MWKMWKYKMLKTIFNLKMGKLYADEIEKYPHNKKSFWT